jgi:hypothetical protein
MVTEDHVKLTVVVVDLALVVYGCEFGARLDAFLGVLDKELEAPDPLYRPNEVRQLTGDLKY